MFALTSSSSTAEAPNLAPVDVARVCDLVPPSATSVPGILYHYTQHQYHHTPRQYRTSHRTRVGR
eukprot:2386752-Rhodomonas_salina.2